MEIFRSFPRKVLCGVYQPPHNHQVLPIPALHIPDDSKFSDAEVCRLITNPFKPFTKIFHRVNQVLAVFNISDYRFGRVSFCFLHVLSAVYDCSFKATHLLRT